MGTFAAAELTASLVTCGGEAGVDCTRLQDRIRRVTRETPREEEPTGKSGGYRELTATYLSISRQASEAECLVDDEP